MSTIEKRKQMLSEALRNFENANGALSEKNGYAFIAGFYNSLIQTLASDKVTDFTYAMEVLRRNTK
jgi:hypothetical protein